MINEEEFMDIRALHRLLSVKSAQQRHGLSGRSWRSREQNAVGYARALS